MINQFELETFRAALENAFNKHKEQNNPQSQGIPFVKLEMGKKNCRVVKGEKFGAQECHTSAYCFIDLASGDILKPAGYKAPAKNGARGNILGENPLNGCGPYGVNYLKGKNEFSF